jgi:hypothetical protein
LRAAWTNSREAYGARKAALRGLAAWKVNDVDDLLAAALKVPADRHSIAATALKLLLETPGAKARELAVLYSRYGQPPALRSVAVGAFESLAKDDVALRDILVSLVDDPDRSVRYQSWGAVRALKVTQAYPALKAQLTHETSGFSGFAHRMLTETLDALKDKEPSTAEPAAAKQNSTIAELERQAAELELKTSELRSRITALKRAVEQGAPAAKTPAAPTTSTTAH